MKKGLTLFAALLTLVGCNSQKKSETADETQAPKYAVVYYSQTGATQKVAQLFAQQLGADLISLEVEQPYDGTYQQTIERCQKEMAANEVPALKPLTTDFAQYDVIFLGYPIWFGTYAQPIASLVKQVDFAGKKIVPFCTFGSGGLAASAEQLKKALPKADIQPGYGVRNARTDKAPAEVDRFLKENGYIAGKWRLPISARHAGHGGQARNRPGHRLSLYRTEPGCPGTQHPVNHLRHRKQRTGNKTRVYGSGQIILAGLAGDMPPYGHSCTFHRVAK